MDKLKQLRKTRNVTQIEVANFLHIEQSTYSGYETGKSKPSIDILKNISKFLNTSIDYLVGNENSNEFYRKNLSKQDLELQELTEKLNEIEKAKVIGYAKARLEEQNQQNNKSKK